ncbi:MAG: HEAT repeat domain-containing protein [Candidatus Heimdallarchaeaceae archaeon]
MMNFVKGLFIERKLRSEDPLERAFYAIFQQKKRKTKKIDKLLALLEDKNWNVRSAAASSVINLVLEYPNIRQRILTHLHELIEKPSLAVKLSIMEILGQLRDYSSKQYLLKILKESDYDLQYAAIRAIGYLDDVDVLYSLQNVVYAKDYITRRAAILSVIRIANSVKEEDQLEKLTPHIHLLIEAYLELDQLGEIICKILDYGDRATFPKMKGYTEAEIVKLEGLIETKDYSVEMYQNFAKLIFPVYFPIEEDII